MTTACIEQTIEAEKTINSMIYPFKNNTENKSLYFEKLLKQAKEIDDNSNKGKEIKYIHNLINNTLLIKEYLVRR